MRLIIKEIRTQKKLTQNEIVALCGINKRTYVDYENGKADIPLSKLQNIATALNVDIFDLFENAPKKSFIKDEDAISKISELESRIDFYKEKIEFVERKLEDCEAEKKLNTSTR